MTVVPDHLQPTSSVSAIEQTLNNHPKIALLINSGFFTTETKVLVDNQALEASVQFVLIYAVTNTLAMQGFRPDENSILRVQIAEIYDLSELNYDAIGETIVKFDPEIVLPVLIFKISNFLENILKNKDKYEQRHSVMKLSNYLMQIATQNDSQQMSLALSFD